jgi:hypothetical protein
MPASFRYIHQTVEHCMKTPTPSNVRVAHVNDRETVYAVDLPASVWAIVKVSKDDMYDNDILPFPSASLRQEWLNNYINSSRTLSPR